MSTMDIHEILKYLPHRYPLLLVDKVISIEAEKNIVALCKKEVISGIVIGESIAGNEAVNEVHEKVKRFADRLSKATALPLFFQREDFSSVEAHRFQTTAGARDDSAAAIILQRFLDKKKHIAL